jgi:UDP-glucuronate 4-epimerase
MAPMQPGDVERTWADVAPLEAETGFKPTTSLEEGVERFVAWLREWRARRDA